MHICFIDACASTSAKESTSSETTATDYEGKITEDNSIHYDR